MKPALVHTLTTAAGLMFVEATHEGIARLEQVEPGELDDEYREPAPGAAVEYLTRLADQLDAYCAGDLREFDLPVDWEAAGVHDEFSREVYREIQRVPYGETATYGQISSDAGRPRNARQVGRLCSIVPVSFVIPVHRVIRADGGLGRCPDYRLRLLEHERRNLGARSPVPLGTV